MSETDNKTAKPNEINPKENNPLDRDSNLFSGNQTQPDDTFVQDSTDFLDELNFLTFDNEPFDNSNLNNPSKQEPRFSEEIQQKPIEEPVLRTTPPASNSILHGNHNNFAWNAPKAFENNEPMPQNKNFSQAQDTHESSVQEFNNEMADEALFSSPSQETFNTQHDAPINDPKNIAIDNSAFDELYDIPSSKPSTSSQNPLMEDLPGFASSPNNFKPAEPTHRANPIENNKNFPEKPKLPPINKTTTPPITTPKAAPSDARPRGVPISYNVSQYSRLFSSTSKQKPKVEKPTQVENKPAPFQSNSASPQNNHEAPVSFPEPEVVDDQQFEQLLDSLDDELGGMFDDVQNNHKAQVSAIKQNDAETATNQAPSSYKQETYIPDIETYQFDNEQVEKTEAFEIPAVNYEEKDKVELSSFEDEFDDVFKIGTNSNNDSSTNSDEEFYNSATSGKTNSNNLDTQGESSELGISDWDIFDENILYAENQDEWSKNQSITEYQQMPPKQNSFKKILISGVCLVAIMVLGGGAYYYFGHANQSGEAQIIHADNSPIRLVPENQQTTNSASTDYQNTNEPQEELVDTSETPQTLEPLASSQTDNFNAPNVTEETSPVSSPNIESALTSGANSSIPTNTTIAVVVKPDGSVVTERVPALNSQETEIQTDSTQAAETHNQTDTYQDLSSTNTQTNPEVTLPTNSQEDLSNTQTPSTNDETANNANISNSSNQQENSSVQNSAQSLNTEPQEIVVPDKPLVSSQASNTTQTDTELQNQNASQTPQQIQAAGGYYVQLSSQPDENAARLEMGKLQSRYASILNGKQAEIQRAEIAGRGTYYRIRIPVGSRESANSLCQTIQANGGNCLVTR